MRSICVFAASNSTNSINQKLALYAASMLQDTEIDLLDLNDYEVAIYSPEREAQGVPPLIEQFNSRLGKSDGLIVSFAEHNGAYSAAFKNIFDWTSRLSGDKGWTNKPVLLLSTSPGRRGGATVLEIAVNKFPHMGMRVVGSFSLPSFYDNFADSEIGDEVIRSRLSQEIQKFSEEV